tara:strand:- start:185 stop:979 length:795 start_codon:yes stop_codon:yes gene_type:complete
MLRGSSPIRLSQLDVTPMVQAAQTLEAANVNLNNAINQSILSFAQKQEQKKQDKIGIQAIQNMFGLDETTAKAMYKDDVVRDAFVMKQKADADLVRKQKEQVELEILQGEQQRVQEQRDILERAIMPNTDTSGMVDKEGVKRTFIQLGGTDESVLGLFDTPGEIKIDDKGIITQDGVFKGQIASSLLDIEPTEEEKEKTKLELEKRQAEIDKLNAQIAKIKGEMPTTEFDPEKLEGIDKDAYDYAITNPGTPESEEILIRLGAK